MKIQKVSLANAQGKLSRNEMKTITAGLVSGSGLKKCCWTVDHSNCSICNTGTSCVANAILLDC
jgi:hypothetical protein